MINQNHVIAWMQERNLPMSVAAYVEVNWCGEKTFDELEGEDRAEVEDLIEEGILHLETSGSEKI